HAVVLCARPDQFEISPGGERIGNRRKEARPARAAIKLHRRGEERQTATSTDEHPRSLLVIEWAGEGALGAFPTQHIKLRRCEDLLPLRFRVFEWLAGEHYVCTFRQILFPGLLQFFRAHCHSRLLCSAPRPRQRDDKGRDRQIFEQCAPLHAASIVAPNVLPNCALLTAYIVAHNKEVCHHRGEST